MQNVIFIMCFLCILNTKNEEVQSRIYFFINEYTSQFFRDFLAKQTKILYFIFASFSC